MNNLGRENISWSQQLWNRIDQAVNAEALRTKVAAKFLPLYGPLAEATTVPADTVDPQTLTVEEGSVTPLIEIWAEFALTKQQVDGEELLSTAVTLATRATNLLSQAEDLLIFQGDKAIKENPLFTENKIHHRTGPAGIGLLNAPANDQIIVVEPVDQIQKRYGENTFGAVAEGYSRLQNKGHYGPYALVLQTDIYADTYAPLRTTLIMPADRIKPLMTAGFHGTGTLPPLRGLITSIGGNTMDLVVGTFPTTEFMLVDNEGLYRFRVFERFALRLKDKTSIIRLEFKDKKG